MQTLDEQSEKLTASIAELTTIINVETANQRLRVHAGAPTEMDLFLDEVKAERARAQAHLDALLKLKLH